MRIFCTILRNNGTYKTIAVKAGKKTFELDKSVYRVKNYRIGKIGPLTILRAIYVEGLPDPMEFDIDASLKKAKLRIDAKGIKNLTNKKILDVFGEAEFTRLETIFILCMLATMGISFITFIIILLNVT